VCDTATDDANHLLHHPQMEGIARCNELRQLESFRVQLCCGHHPVYDAELQRARKPADENSMWRNGWSFGKTAAAVAVVGGLLVTAGAGALVLVLVLVLWCWYWCSGAGALMLG
jgi:hypothetical protein